jgi:hypothetical protein
LTLNDIPKILRQPGLIVYNGQKTHVVLTERQCDALAFMVDLNQVYALNKVSNRAK